MNKKKVAEKLIRAWRMVDEVDKTGYFGDENIFSDIKGKIADALLYMTGEENKVYTESHTFRNLELFCESPKEAAAKLIETTEAETEADRTIEIKQPAPTFFTQAQVDWMYRTFGGYRHDA